MDHNSEAQSCCGEESRDDPQKESDLGPKETSHAEEEADCYPTETGGAPSYAVAAQETRHDQTEADGLEEDEYEKAKTPHHQTQQALGHPQTQESDSHEVN
jgi:hypothetical protein